jgi:hypothetical protein
MIDGSAVGDGEIAAQHQQKEQGFSPARLRGSSTVCR